MKTWTRPMLLAVMVLMSSRAAAWITAAGTVEQIWTYSGTDTVLVKLSTPGAPSAACSDSTVFAVDSSLPPDRRKQMIAVFMSAQARQAEVQVSYDELAGCASWGGTPNIYRIALRVVSY